MSEWPTPPTWSDRQTYGRDIPLDDVVSLLAEVPEVAGGGLIWKHIHFLATMYAENNGFMEWARPMVYKPGDVAHLTTDRGICALNSHWWGHVPDGVAYDWEEAVKVVLQWLHDESVKGTKGAKEWDWKPLLDWQWHGYGTEKYHTYIPIARAAVNLKREELGITSI